MRKTIAVAHKVLNCLIICMIMGSCACLPLPNQLAVLARSFPSPHSLLLLMALVETKKNKTHNEAWIQSIAHTLPIFRGLNRKESFAWRALYEVCWPKHQCFETHAGKKKKIQTLFQNSNGRRDLKQSVYAIEMERSGKLGLTTKAM